jgi:hypothetical protein
MFIGGMRSFGRPRGPPFAHCWVKPRTLTAGRTKQFSTSPSPITDGFALRRLGSGGRDLGRTLNVVGQNGCLREYATFTADTKPSLHRNPAFKAVSAEDVAYFRSILDSDGALVDGITQDATDDLVAFNTDWMKKYRGKSQLVLKPTSTQQVSEILKYCNKSRLAVNPQGGNSGLAGGSVPVFDEIVISLARMRAVRSFDDISGVLVAEAGLILQDADD